MPGLKDTKAVNHRPEGKRSEKKKCGTADDRREVARGQSGTVSLSKEKKKREARGKSWKSGKTGLV